MKMLNKLTATKTDKKAVLLELFDVLTSAEKLSTVTEIIFEIHSEIYPLGYSLEHREQVCTVMSEVTRKLFSLFHKKDFNSPGYLLCTGEILHLVDLSLLPDNCQ